jgi:hypothetical protein
MDIEKKAISKIEELESKILICRNEHDKKLTESDNLFDENGIESLKEIQEIEDEIQEIEDEILLLEIKI